VKNVKLDIKPTTTPQGYFFEPVTELDKIIGKSGKIHGDSIVTNPAINAKNNKTSIKVI